MTRTERQLECIEKWKAAKCRASISAATGVGKTHIALMAVERVLRVNPNTKITVIVPTKVLKDQWEENIEKHQIEGNIQVLVINTAAKKSFDCNFLIIDELHKANSDYFRKIFENCTPKLILGLTATYERLDQKQKEVADKFCPICDTITTDEAVKNGWLSEYKEYKVLLDVDLTEYNKANVSFMQHFAFFGYNFDIAMSCVSDFWQQQKYAKQMNCTLQEVKVHTYAWNKALRFRKQFVANHPKKIEIAKKILAARPNSKAITFNSSIKQCEAFKMGFVVHSGKGKKKNQMTLDEFSKCGPGSVIHSSKMLIEGLDCPGLNLAIILGFNSSKTSKVQEIGRVIRKEPEKNAEIFTLVLRNTVEENWYRKSMENLNYIELNEHELDAVLNNQNIDNKKEITQEEVKNIFRF